MYWNFWLSTIIFWGAVPIMQNKDLSTTAVSTARFQEAVELNLTISGAREQILHLLEQMNAVPGFSVLKGSFIVSTSRNTPV